MLMTSSLFLLRANSNTVMQNQVINEPAERTMSGRLPRLNDAGLVFADSDS